MDRAQYARYLLSRLAQSLLIMLGAAMLAHLLRLLGWPRWAATGPSSSRQHPIRRNANDGMGQWDCSSIHAQAIYKPGAGQIG